MVINKVPKASAVVINASILIDYKKKSFSLAVALYLITLIAVFLISAG